MDDLQKTKKYLKMVVKSQAKAERRQAIAAKERAELREQFKRTDEQFKRTDEQFKRTDEQMKRTDIFVGHLSNKFGDLAEAMLVGDVSETLKKIDNLHLQSTHFNSQSFKDDRPECEVDALLVGRDSVVVMEAKSNLTIDKIGRFVDNVLKQFVERFPDLAGKNIYGAVGYLKAEEGAVKRAINEGLLVVRSTIQTKEIINPDDFQPKNYNPRH